MIAASRGKVAIGCTWSNPWHGQLILRANRGRRLLIEDRFPVEAAVLGLPVGFVGAAEAKDAFAAGPRGLPFLVVRGRMGGSAMAAAAINALARPGL